tara:strand:- start:906 stop:1181 length:276 start_codon:yes stop_codon:yes gene_type:complete
MDELACGIDEGVGSELGHALDLDVLAVHLADFPCQQIEVAIAGGQHHYARLGRVLDGIERDTHVPVPLAVPSPRWMNGLSFTSKPIVRNVF